MGYLCLSLVAGHLIVFGIQGWWTPRGWHWSLPPISLLGAAVAIAPLAMKFWPLTTKRI